MSQPYQLSDIYQNLKEMTRLWPVEANKPQTFCVLTSMTALSLENLGRDIRDKNRSYFYSKAWADVMYNPSNVIWSPPGIFIFEQSGTLSSDAQGNTVHTIQLAVLDKMTDADKTLAKASNQEPNANQIFEYTEEIMRKVIQYISKQMTLTDGWTLPFRAAFQQANETIPFNRWESDSLLLYGNLATFDITIPCSTDAITLIDSKEEHTTADHHVGDVPHVEPAALADFGLDTLGDLAGNQDLGLLPDD